MLSGPGVFGVHSEQSFPHVFFSRSLTMAITDDHALQHLAAELARLDRQIAALLKKQDELLQMKSQLEASRGVSHSPTSSSATSEVSPSVLASSPWPHKESGNASAAEGLPDRLLHPAILRPRQPVLLTQLATYSNTSFSAPVACSSTLGLFTGLCARVMDIARRLPNRNAFGNVVIHVGTNDICARQGEVLKMHYQTLLDTARIVISRPLPTYRKGCERSSRLFGLQSWLCGWCAVNGLSFVDNWSLFWEQPALYWRDRLHPSHLGSRILSRNIKRAVC
ncbi:hypothetical protein NFI96_032434 [Prochilodus magdalenae]|nr:hypothetical protein NFI96_032434 [Prochilodus magdalenae]